MSFNLSPVSGSFQNSVSCPEVFDIPIISSITETFSNVSNIANSVIQTQALQESELGSYFETCRSLPSRNVIPADRRSWRSNSSSVNLFMRSGEVSLLRRRMPGLSSKERFQWHAAQNQRENAENSLASRALLIAAEIVNRTPAFSVEQRVIEMATAITEETPLSEDAERLVRLTAFCDEENFDSALLIDEILRGGILSHALIRQVVDYTIQNSQEPGHNIWRLFSALHSVPGDLFIRDIYVLTSMFLNSDFSVNYNPFFPVYEFLQCLDSLFDDQLRTLIFLAEKNDRSLNFTNQLKEILADRNSPSLPDSNVAAFVTTSFPVDMPKPTDLKIAPTRRQEGLLSRIAIEFVRRNKGMNRFNLIEVITRGIIKKSGSHRSHLNAADKLEIELLAGLCDPTLTVFRRVAKQLFPEKFSLQRVIQSAIAHDRLENILPVLITYNLRTVSKSLYLILRALIQKSASFDTIHLKSTNPQAQSRTSAQQLLDDCYLYLTEKEITNLIQLAMSFIASKGCEVNRLLQILRQQLLRAQLRQRRMDRSSS